MYEIHPICAAFPAMTDDELLKLAVDIGTKGLLHPISLYNSTILDGKNRLKACEIAGVEPRFDDYVGNDPIGYAVSLNLKRRHLDESQRAMVAARLANITAGGDRRSDQNATLRFDHLSLDQAAKQLNVSPRSVTSAKLVIKSGGEQLVRQVDAGLVSVNEAYKQTPHRPYAKRGAGLAKKTRKREPPIVIKMKPMAKHESLTAEEIGERPAHVGRFDNVHAPPVMMQSYAMLAMQNDRHMPTFNLANAVADVQRRLREAPQLAPNEIADAFERMLEHVPNPEARNGEERDFAKEARATLSRLSRALKPALDRLTEIYQTLKDRGLIDQHRPTSQTANASQA